MNITKKALKGLMKNMNKFLVSGSDGVWFNTFVQNNCSNYISKTQALKDFYNEEEFENILCGRGPDQPFQLLAYKKDKYYPVDFTLFCDWKYGFEHLIDEIENDKIDIASKVIFEINETFTNFYTIFCMNCPEILEDSRKKVLIDISEIQKLITEGKYPKAIELAGVVFYELERLQGMPNDSEIDIDTE